MQSTGARWTGKTQQKKLTWDNCPLFTFNCSTSPSRRDVEYDFARHA